MNAVAPGAIDTVQALPGVVAFMASPDGAWTTGQIVDASGGTKL